MAVITPTITTNDPHEYRHQMELITMFSEGVHIDFADGVFAPTDLLPVEKAWRNDELIVHAHIMCQNPLELVDDILNLEADLVILHAEADSVKKTLELLAETGTRTGIALLPETSLLDLDELEIDGLYDHVLVFGGNLGFQGGEADLTQLNKVTKLREQYTDVEIGWDGGVNDKNIEQIVAAGVDVVNVGGFIKNAANPKKAYSSLQSLLS